MIHNKYAIGLTGGSGAGKSTLLQAAAAFPQILAIDCDKELRAIMQHPHQCYAEIAAAFPECIRDNAIDRKQLAATVFSNSEQLELLNGITHKHIEQHIINLAAQTSCAALLIDAPVLHKSKLAELCDTVIVVTAPPEIRIARIMSRDNISRDAALQRLSNQPTDEEYAAMGDIILRNNGDLREFSEACTQAIEQALHF